MEQLVADAAVRTHDVDETIKVEKRDGRIVPFDRVNIIHAIEGSFKGSHVEVGPEEERLIEQMAQRVESAVTGRYNGPVRIDDIQSLVEHELVNEHLYDIAKAYTSYRLDKDIKRAKASDVNEAIKKLINKDESLVRENANKDSNVYATQRDLLAGTVSKASAMKMLPADVANAHMKGDIHFHDADYSPFTPMTNCSLPDFGDMLRNGFELGNAMMDSPKSIGTAATQITQIIKDIAGSQYGGQTVNRADEMLAEYAQLDYQKHLDMAEAVFPDDEDLDIARTVLAGFKAREPKWLHFENRAPLPMDEPFHDDVDELQQIREIYAKIMTRKSIYDAMQTMEYQINSNRVSNGQTPFVTVGFGLGTDWFAREIQRAIFLIRIRGLGKDRHTALRPAYGGRPRSPAVPHQALQGSHSHQRPYPLRAWRLRPPQAHRQRGRALPQQPRHHFPGLHRPLRDHRHVLWQGLDDRPFLG